MQRKPLIMLIVESSPPKPSCFDRQSDWQSWLVSAHHAGLKVMRRVDVGARPDDRRTWHQMLPTKQIDYCSDCTPRRQKTMEAVGRCDPCLVRHEEPSECTR